MAPIRRARNPDVRTREEHPTDAVTIPAPPAAHFTCCPQPSTSAVHHGNRDSIFAISFVSRVV